MSQEMLQEDAQLIWADLLDAAQAHGLEDLLVWLGRAQPATFDGTTMCLVTRQKWAARNLMGKFRPTVEELLQEITMEPVALDVQVDDAGAPAQPAAVQPVAAAAQAPQQAPAAGSATPQQQTDSLGVAAPGVAAPCDSAPAPDATLHEAPATQAPQPPASQPAAQAAGLSAAALAGRAAAQGHAPIRSRLFQSFAQDQPVAAQTSNPQQVSNDFSTAGTSFSTPAATMGGPAAPVTPIPVLEDGAEQKDEVKVQSGTDFTFDTYIVGESNRIAYNLAKAVAEQPDGSLFNPLFIWGPSGNGKTHLLLSIRDYIGCHQPQTQALYITANAFVTQFIDEIRNRKLRGNEVLRAYRDVDVLLVDDVQFFEDKQDSVTAFFDIFNEMMLSGGKQIVLAADRAPDYLRLDPRMRTRFGQGMVADIKAPTWEMKVSILKSFYERLRQRNGMTGVTLTDKALELMADYCPDNPRQMAGLINNVMFNAEMDPSILTEDGLRGTIDAMFKQVAVINLDHIMDVVAKESGVTKEQMSSDSRVKQVKEARQLVMWLASQLTDEPYTSIGGALSRDHSTVSHGIKKVNERRETDRGYMHMLEDLKNKVMQ